MKPKLYLLNGPLGAGKTTLLKNLIRQPLFSGARVIENEFASTSVDTAQLHDHVEEVKTIAGLCICCSTGDELTTALTELATGPAPVIIEATGVANSLVLLEKLVVADMLGMYDLAAGIFVLDATEVNEQVLQAYTDELRAADRVLVTKTDLVTEGAAVEIERRLADMGVASAQRVLEGAYDATHLPKESGMLEYFAASTQAFTAHDTTMNHTILKTDSSTVEPSALEAAWPVLVEKYGLRRMKGDFSGEDGAAYHVEATPSQCRISRANTEVIASLVFIGERALEINNTSFNRVLEEAK